MISYIPDEDRLVGGMRDDLIRYSKVFLSGVQAPFVAPETEWPSRYGIGQRLIKPHCGTIKRQQFNDCTCNMITNIMECVRSIMGLPHEELSATAVYNHINGGRDAGSNLHDAAEYVTDIGCVPVSMWPPSVWRMSEPTGYKAMAGRYRGLEWIDIRSAADVVTAVGWFARPVGIGVSWGMGGHAIMVCDYNSRTSVPKEHLDAYAGFVKWLDGVDKSDADLCGKALGDSIWFQIENSWGESYGEGGFGWLPWSQVDSGIRSRYGGVCVTSTTYSK